MDEERAHIEKLLKQHQSNLREFQQQRATYGTNVPIELINNIKQTEAHIQELHLKLTDLTSPPRLTPYQGLSAFQEKDASYFFGRETFSHQLIKSVREKPFVAVLGPSGSGKSSVVFAGLIVISLVTPEWNQNPENQKYKSICRNSHDMWYSSSQ